MKDDVIKNPARANPIQTAPKYVPEHVRLGVNPVSMPAPPATYTPPNEMYFANQAAYDDNGNEIVIPDGEVIDNNDFVNLGPYEHKTEIRPPAPIENNTPSEAPKVGDYILMVSNRMIMSGALSSIEAKVKAIVYGEDQEFASVEVSTDDIVVLKRLNIRIGVFIEE